MASAVALQPRTTGTLTITISGTCTEAVDFVPSNVILQAAGSGDGLTAPDATTNPVLGISGQNVVLNNLTVTGGVTPLLVHPGAVVTGNNLVLAGANSVISADLVSQGFIHLVNSTVQNSVGDGIQAQEGGTVLLDGGTVQNNGGSAPNPAVAAVAAFQVSRVIVSGGAVIRDNQGDGGYAETAGIFLISNGTIQSNAGFGINIQYGGVAKVNTSSALVQGNAAGGINVYSGTLGLTGGVVSGNSGNGIQIFNSSTVVLNRGAVVASNTGNGIFVQDATVNIGTSSGPATIQANQGNGVVLKTNSVAFFNNSGNQIVNNAPFGILCDGPPANPLISGNIGTVSGNGLAQIACNAVP